jgi:hypothetical protein
VTRSVPRWRTWLTWATFPFVANENLCQVRSAPRWPAWPLSSPASSR